MNTRLQVEHPVTEQVSGGWSEVRSSGLAGSYRCRPTIGLRQHQVSLQGHAIEARLYAEDPSAGFLPSIGTVLKVIEPIGEHLEWTVHCAMA